MNKHLSALALAAACLSGCTLAPDYERPAAPIPADFPEGEAYSSDGAASEAPAASYMPWEEFYRDDKLRFVIALTLENNRDLRVAALNVERMRMKYNIERSALLPTIAAGGSAQRTRNPGDLSSGGSGSTTSQYQADFGFASWEIDLFGRIRSMSEAALQEYFSTEQNRRTVQVMLVSQVGDAYFTLAADLSRLKLAKTTLETRRRAFEIAQERHAKGLSPLLDVHRTQAQVDAARVSYVTFIQVVAIDRNALDFFAGATVPENLLPADLDTVVEPASVSAGISSLALLNRPDIIASEHLLMAANANIGAARAAFFPRISLTAAAGTASSDLSSLFKSGQGMWTYGAQIVMPIFDPRTWAAVRVSKADKAIAIAQYEKSIQAGFREVADALAVRGTILQQIESQREFVDSQTEVYQLSNVRYTRGLDGYLSVLDSERELYAAQLELVALELNRLTNQVKLYAVLGGGWKSTSDMTDDAEKES